MAATPSRQALRRWGNSLGIRLPAAIAREAQLQEDQAVELSVVEGGVLIRPVQPRLSLAERLAAYEPMPGEPTEAMAFPPLGAEVVE
jgi:antitoxin MazE